MSDTHVTKEMAQLIARVVTIKIKTETMPNGKKFAVHPERRHIRHRLFKIRAGTNTEEEDGGLKKWIELQFRPGMGWDNFTFEWDVSPSEPLKVVAIHEWVAEGGLLEQSVERIENGVRVFSSRCTPTAFTKQG